MPFRRGGDSQTSKYGYIVELEYEGGDTDYDSVSDSLPQARKDAQAYKSDSSIKTLRLYPKDENGRANAKTDPIVEWSR